MSSLPITGPRPLPGPLAGPATARPVPTRVRHQARESVAVMAMSVALSGGLATVIVLLSSLGR